MKNSQNINQKHEKDINDFLERVDLIYQSSYLQDHKKQNVELNWKKDEGMKITSTLPSRESIESFLMRIRPVIVQKERLYIGKIITYLIQLSDNEKEIKELSKLKSLIEKHRNKRLFSIKVDNKEYGMPDFVWLYLYGKYFHLEKKKKEIIQQFENVLGPFTEVSALSQIEAYAGWAMFLAGYIKKRKNKSNIIAAKNN